MNVTINGEARRLPDGSTIREMLGSLGITKARVAVEVNRDVVPRRRHEETPLAEGDVIEVVTLVGGG